jgi:hypothetical protein
MANFMPSLLYAWKIFWSILWIGGWVGPRAGMDDIEKRKFFL